MGKYYDGPQEQAAGMAGMAGMLEVRNHNMLPRLKAQRDELQQRIVKIDKLMGLLEQNPEFVQMLDLTRELI